MKFGILERINSRVIRVFISSTFRDMQDERKHTIKYDCWFD